MSAPSPALSVPAMVLDFPKNVPGRAMRREARHRGKSRRALLHFLTAIQIENEQPASGSVFGDQSSGTAAVSVAP